jgi:nucleotide-binding universal stress UspA family protein
MAEKARSPLHSLGSQKVLTFGQVPRSTRPPLGYTGGMKTILAPLDFSAVSEAVVNEAAALAQAHGGRVVLLNVVQPPVMLHEYAALTESIAEITASGEKNAARELAKHEAKLLAASLVTESVQLVGSPISNIVEQAEKFGADYIVMGSHGHTALYDLLVGSTTHGVLLRAKCPVVIVPAPRGPKARKGMKTQTATA